MPRLAVQKQHTFSGHRDCLYTLAPTGTGESFFSAGADGLVVQWQLATPDQGQLLAKAEASIYAMAYEQEQDWLFFGQNYDGIRLIEINSKKNLSSLQVTKSAIFSLEAWGGKIFAGTGSGHLLVLQQNPLRVLHEIQLSEKSLRAIALHAGWQELALGYSDGKIRILDLNTLALKQELDAHQNSVFTVQYSPDGRYLLSGSRDAHIKAWSVADRYELAKSIVGHMYTINHLSYSPNGKLFASCSMDKSVKVWDAEAFKLLKVIDKVRHAGHGTSVNRLLWLNNSTLASASDDRTISIWNIEHQEAI
jgi:WD40 repeat protein